MKKIILVALLLVPTMLMAQKRQVEELPAWNLKTNLLSDITTTMNLGIEFRLGGHTSLDIPVSWNPWEFRGGKTMFKHLEIKPELRFWPKETFRGHWFDIHGGWANYEVGGLWHGPFTQYMHDNRFKGDLWGVGIGWGYRWNFSFRWALEATIGVGYAHLNYDQYYGTYKCLDCDEMVGKRDKDYFGPTKLGLNLIIGLGAKPQPAPEPVIIVVERYEPEFEVVYVVPEVEPVKVRQEMGRAYLEYHVGRSEIVPNFRNNAAELETIKKTIDLVRNDEDVTMKGISLVGWASPEGTESSNQKLSENRAAELELYIEKHFGVDSRMITAEGSGEDWQTFSDLLDEANYSYSDQIIRIIDGGSADADVRERMIREVDGGRPYAEILRDIYPKLRRTDYFIDYEVAPITVERAREVILVRPTNLSLEEMFRVAETYERGSEKHREVMEIAARTYPNSDVANMNAAAHALERGDSTAAAGFLGKIKDHGAAWNNNMGILWWLRGDKAAAERHFSAAGNTAAVNVAELQKHLNSIR